MDNFDIVYAHENYFSERAQKITCTCCGSHDYIDNMVAFANNVNYCSGCYTSLTRKMPKAIMECCKDEINHGNDEALRFVNAVIWSMR